jgi:hypothetical protein
MAALLMGSAQAISGMRQQFSKPRISYRLLFKCLGLRNDREPSAHLFLKCDDRHGHLAVIGTVEPRQQSSALCGGASEEYRQQISIKNEHGESSPSLVCLMRQTPDVAIDATSVLPRRSRRRSDPNQTSRLMRTTISRGFCPSGPSVAQLLLRAPSIVATILLWSAGPLPRQQASTT